VWARVYQAKTVTSVSNNRDKLVVIYSNARC